MAANHQAPANDDGVIPFDRHGCHAFLLPSEAQIVVSVRGRLHEAAPRPLIVAGRGDPPRAGQCAAVHERLGRGEIGGEGDAQEPEG